MSTAPKHYITPEEYLEQERKSDEWRSEYIGGEVFPISGASQYQKDRRWLLSEHFDTTVSIALSSIDLELLLSDVYEKVKP